MKRLLDVADGFMKICSWKDLALIKVCVATAGILIGMAIPKKHRLIPTIGLTTIFFASYIPAMKRFISYARTCKVEDETDMEELADV